MSAALGAVASGEVQVVTRQPARIVLRCGDDDTALRVAVELHADGEGTTLTANDEGRGISPDHVKAGLLAGFVVCLGLGMPAELPIRSLMFAASLPSLMFLVASSIDARRQRPADFRRALQAVDRAVASLRTHDPRPYRALARSSERRRGSDRSPSLR